MEGWVDGWMDGWMHAWMDGWANGPIIIETLLPSRFQSASNGPFPIRGHRISIGGG